MVLQLSKGMKVTPNLRLDRLVGEGAMGSVWVAHHEGLDSDVAVKFIARDHRRDAHDKALLRFGREAKAAARIKSPHVVHTYDHGVTDDGTPYIVMELLDGESLGERLRRNGHLSLQELRQVVLQVGKALGKAHALGIVHRDIKPDNIFLVPNDDELLVKVLDFGIAKHVEDEQAMTTTGAMIGTPLYMSPELIRSSRNATPATDLWALGVVAYESLTGAPPFTGETVGALFFSICGDSVEPASSQRKGVSAALDGWFNKALCQEPDLRFSDAKTMSKAFVAATGATETLAEPTASAPIVDDAALATADFVTQQNLEAQVDGGDTIAEDERNSHGRTQPSAATVADELPTGDEHDRTMSPGSATLEGAAATLANERPKGSRWWLWAAAAATVGTGVLLWATTPGDATEQLPPAPISQPVSVALEETALSVTCEPACDLITVDGRKYRSGDLSSNDGVLQIVLAAGEHELQMMRDGYETRVEKIDLKAGQPMQQRYELERKMGELPKGVVDKIMTGAKYKFDACHQVAQGRIPRLEGRLRVKVTIGLRGEVIEVDVPSTLGDEPFRKCIAQSLRSLGFPAPEGGFVDAEHELLFVIKTHPVKPQVARNADDSRPRQAQQRDLGNYYAPNAPRPPVQPEQHTEQHTEQHKK